MCAGILVWPSTDSRTGPSGGKICGGASQRIVDAVAAHFDKQKAGPAKPASLLKCLHQILYIDAKGDGPDNITR